MKPKISFDIFKKKDLQTQFMMLYTAQPIDLGFMMHKLASENPDAAQSLAQLCLKAPHHREHFLEMQAKYNEIYPLLPDLITKNSFTYVRVLRTDVPIVCKPLCL